MNVGYRAVCLDHETGPRHPERADRLRAIRERLQGSDGVEYEHPPNAGVDDLTRVHDAEYVDRVRSFCAGGGGRWRPDTVAVEETWDAALASAGIACWAVEAALDGCQGRDAPFSLGRPPGHHAVADDAMGFCFFNNVAVAVDRALDRESVRRVAVADWDVHHGNGTQEMFYDRGGVFYASIHERGIFPGTGHVGETGAGAGEGTTMNLPLPGGAADPDYVAAVEDAVAPALRRFDPDLVVVSAGFDAHRDDTISRMSVSTEGYGVLTDRIRAVCSDVDAPVAFVLEGGYNLDALAESVWTVNETVAGRDPVEPEGEPGDSVRSVIDEALDALRL